MEETPIYLRTAVKVSPERTLNHLTNTVLAVKYHTEEIPNHLMEPKRRLAAIVHLEALVEGKRATPQLAMLKIRHPQQLIRATVS